MRNVCTPAVLLVTLVLLGFAKAQRYPSNLPRLPSGELLVEGFVPDTFLLTTATQTFKLQEDAIGLGISPSISADGGIVASAHRVPNDPSRRPRLVASTFSVKARRWTDHPEFEGVESISISPDGSKLACVTRDNNVHSLGVTHFRLRILDLRTGDITVLRDSLDWPMGLSWSPDSLHLAYDLGPRDTPDSNARVIYIASLDENTTCRIGPGQSASWSPSGESIAFVSFEQRYDISHSEVRYAASEYQIRIIRIGDIQSLFVMAFHSDVDPILQPVWSPDSKTLLLNTSRDADNSTFDIHMVDLITGKAKTKFKNVGPVYAWVKAK